MSKHLEHIIFAVVKLAACAALLLAVQPLLRAQQTGNLDQQLFAASGNRDLIAAEKIIRRGANLEARATNGLTPLMSAAESGSVPLVSLLLENGANAAAKDDQGETALSWGARGGWVKLVNLLARFSDTAAKNHALMVAIEGGPVTIEISPSNMSPNLTNPPQDESLEVEESWTATVETLLDNGADIEARDDDGDTPLLWAASFAQTDIFKLLLDRGAKIDVRDRQGNTPLIAAACECAVATMNSAYAVMKILLEHGAAVNARNHDGRTALMMASGMTGDASVLHLLLDNGADPRLKDHTGKTALSIAKECRREDKIAILKTAAVY
ncbi:MAG TPA: ankyrin repeat domain-containing protein [Terriglobales bacterium]|nr:ankyrin repeat domain-containing protein [Terriglobales bacterium]